VCEFLQISRAIWYISRRFNNRKYFFRIFFQIQIPEFGIICLKYFQSFQIDMPPTNQLTGSGLKTSRLYKAKLMDMARRNSSTNILETSRVYRKKRTFMVGCMKTSVIHFQKQMQKLQLQILAKLQEIKKIKDIITTTNNINKKALAFDAIKRLEQLIQMGGAE
jgi:hypothetical protein